MKWWKKAAAVLAAVVLLCGGFFLGRLSLGGPAVDEPPWQETSIFHAEILERDGRRFHVKGLECNDVNDRGEFIFSVKEGTPLVWRYTRASLEDFQAGDRIAVTWTGWIEDMYPAHITQVLCVDLLEDEK